MGNVCLWWGRRIRGRASSSDYGPAELTDFVEEISEVGFECIKPGGEGLIRIDESDEEFGLAGVRRVNV